MLLQKNMEESKSGLFSRERCRINWGFKHPNIHWTCLIVKISRWNLWITFVLKLSFRIMGVYLVSILIITW